jgi:hypothetical protein
MMLSRPGGGTAPRVEDGARHGGAWPIPGGRRAMITVLGGSGFVGSRLVQRLRETGAAYRAPARGEPLDAATRTGVVLTAGASLHTLRA